MIDSPLDVAVDQDGDFLVTNEGGVSIVKIDPDTGNQTLLTSNGYFVDPEDIIVLKNGEILVSDRLGRIVEVDPDSGVQTEITSGGYLIGPTSLTEMPNGELLVADRFSGLILIDLEATPAPTQSLLLASGHNYETEGATAFNLTVAPNYSASFAQETATLLEGSTVSIEIAVNYGPQNADPAELSFNLEADNPSWLEGITFESEEYVVPGDEFVYTSVRLYSGDEVLNEPRTVRLRMASATPSLNVPENEYITIQIQDDDVEGTVYFEDQRRVLHEGQGDLSFKIKRFINDPGTRTVRVRTVDGTAEAGRDFGALDTIVNFPDGIYEQTLAITGPPVSATPHPLRSFTIEMYDPGSGVILGDPNEVEVTVNGRKDAGSVDFTFEVDDSSYTPRGSYLLEVLRSGKIAANLPDLRYGDLRCVLSIQMEHWILSSLFRPPYTAQ